ncbi:hypothetical protein K523DRAFT_392496 [Schizophyllum commune Tattone D]|nr:hypothetical protein K523DRAFT_392496 [Schizophyllum commune Tattone D]
MQFFIALLCITALFFSCALAKDFDVAVGENAALNFNPSSLTGVQNGDTITFHFLSGNHTLTQSTFDEPCKAKEGGVDSGYQDVQNAGGGDRLHYTITVNNASTPLWFFCGQTGHCPRGMVFAVNPTADKTFADFQGTAKQVTPGSAENPDYVPSVTTNTTMSGATANNGAVSAVWATSYGWLTAALALGYSACRCQSTSTLLARMIPVRLATMRHFTSLPLDDDILQLILCQLPDFQSLGSAICSCKAFHLIYSTYPVQIEYAVATSIVGPAIPQALRVARFELSEDLTGEVEERKDTFPETNEPVRLDRREKQLIYEHAKKVDRLETLFSRRHKTRKPTVSQLTSLESLRLRRAVYRLMLYCHIHGGVDDDWEAEESDRESIEEIYEKHRDFLDQYSTDDLREMQGVADFITEIAHCVRREVEAEEHDIFSMDFFDDFFLARGPLAALECYEARSFTPIEEDAIDADGSEMMFCAFLSQPVERIMSARKAEYRSNHWRAILDSIPDEHATCDRCRTMKGLELYDETNYDALFGVEGLNHRELPRLFKGRLSHHFTERHKIWEYFGGAASFDYGAFLKEIFAFSTPLAASTPVTPAPSTVVAPAHAPVISQSLSLEEWAEAVDDDEGSASGAAAIDQPAASSSTASTSLCSPWDGLSTSSALCADCLKDVISEFLPQWWLERKRNAGETIPTEDCWYGWNCRTQTHKPLHATRLNHFCKPSRGDGV